MENWAISSTVRNVNDDVDSCTQLYGRIALAPPSFVLFFPAHSVPFDCNRQVQRLLVTLLDKYHLLSACAIWLGTIVSSTCCELYLEEGLRLCCMYYYQTCLASKFGLTTPIDDNSRSSLTKITVPSRKEAPRLMLYHLLFYLLAGLVRPTALASVLHLIFSCLSFSISNFRLQQHFLHRRAPSVAAALSVWLPGPFVDIV